MGLVIKWRAWSRTRDSPAPAPTRYHLSRPGTLHPYACGSVQGVQKKKSASTVTAVAHLYFGLFVGFVGLFIVKAGACKLYNHGWYANKAK